MVSAEFHPTKETYTFAEVAEIVKESLRSQINRENLEKLFSYNVSNEKLLSSGFWPDHGIFSLSIIILTGECKVHA